jgi:hypothetical protein
MDTSTLIALGGLVVAALSLAMAFYTARRTRRDREKDQQLQDLRFRQMNELVLTVKPQFSLVPTQKPPAARDYRPARFDRGPGGCCPMPLRN